MQKSTPTNSMLANFTMSAPITGVDIELPLKDIKTYIDGFDAHLYPKGMNRVLISNLVYRSVEISTIKFKVERDDAGDALTLTITGPGWYNPFTKRMRLVNEYDFFQSLENFVQKFVNEYRGALYDQVS